MREFAAKYALIFANEKYDELRKADEGMGDLKWTKDDLMNALATVNMMGIPEKNILKLVDSSKTDLNNIITKLAKIVKDHAKKKENILIYSYAAGHGVADHQQYYLLNHENLKDA